MGQKSMGICVQEYCGEMAGAANFADDRKNCGFTTSSRVANSERTKKKI